MSDPTLTENDKVATELIDQISAAARAGNALVLGPQAVQNLYGLLFDLLSGATVKRS